MRGNFEEPPTGLIPWFSKTEGNTYATIAASPFSLQGKPTQAQDVARRISGAIAGEVFAQVKTYQVPNTIPSPSHLHYLPFASLFPLPNFTLAVLFALSFLVSSSLFRLPFSVCLCVGLLVAMAQDNTKLCDFLNTNNNDFLSTPIAPLNDVESCEINTAWLNLVMKVQFAGLPSEDVATHLNNFVDLCDMPKKKDMDDNIVKLKLFLFSLRDHAKVWFSSLPKNSIDAWNKCKEAFI